MTTQSEDAKVTVFAGLAELTAAEGAELGPTDWLIVDQARGSTNSPGRQTTTSGFTWTRNARRAARTGARSRTDC